jgi:protocatechuate 3,4-dioxygenase beta subunit
MRPLLIFLVVIAAQSQTGTPPRDTASPKVAMGAISGRITEQGSGRPLPRALVTLAASGSSRRLEALADAQGHYEFTSIEPGEYMLSALPGELRMTHLGQVFGQVGPMFSAGPPRSRVKLKAGENLTGLDIALTRALAIEGRILDQWDEPMAGVAVTVVKADGTTYPAMPGYSDDRGEFRAFGLAPGRYRVCASPRNLFEARSSDTVRFVRTCHLASTTESNAADVILDTEDAAGIDIRVQRSGTYSVSGSVLDAGGALADNAGISAIRDDHSVSANSTSRRGRFVLTGLTPGRYLLSAYVGGPANPSDTRPPAREHEVGYASIDIDSADVAEITVSMSKGQRIAGRVVFEGGAPAPNKLRMVVQTREPQSPWWMIGGRPPFSAVEEDFSFELTGVYRLPLIVGIHGLPDGWVLKSVRYDGRDITDVATDFGMASRERRLEILATRRVATPSVRVTDDLGHGATSYQVVLVPADPARWRGAHWSVTGEPSGDGVQKLGPTLPGDYLVAAISWDDYLVLMRDRARIDGLASVARRVTLVEGDSGTLELHITRLPPARQ